MVRQRVKKSVKKDLYNAKASKKTAKNVIKKSHDRASKNKTKSNIDELLSQIKEETNTLESTRVVKKSKDNISELLYQVKYTNNSADSNDAVKIEHTPGSSILDSILRLFENFDIQKVSQIYPNVILPMISYITSFALNSSLGSFIGNSLWPGQDISPELIEMLKSSNDKIGKIDNTQSVPGIDRGKRSLPGLFGDMVDRLSFKIPSDPQTFNFLMQKIGWAMIGGSILALIVNQFEPGTIISTFYSLYTFLSNMNPLVLSGIVTILTSTLGLNPTSHSTIALNLLILLITNLGPLTGEHKVYLEDKSLIGDYAKSVESLKSVKDTSLAGEFVKNKLEENDFKGGKEIIKQVLDTVVATGQPEISSWESITQYLGSLVSSFSSFIFDKRIIWIIGSILTVWKVWSLWNMNDDNNDDDIRREDVYDIPDNITDEKNLQDELVKYNDIGDEKITINFESIPFTNPMLQQQGLPPQSPYVVSLQRSEELSVQLDECFNIYKSFMLSYQGYLEGKAPLQEPMPNTCTAVVGYLIQVYDNIISVRDISDYDVGDKLVRDLDSLRDILVKMVTKVYNVVNTHLVSSRYTKQKNAYLLKLINIMSSMNSINAETKNKIKKAVNLRLANNRLFVQHLTSLYRDFTSYYVTALSFTKSTDPSGILRSTNISRFENFSKSSGSWDIVSDKLEEIMKTFSRGVRYSIISPDGKGQGFLYISNESKDIIFNFIDNMSKDVIRLVKGVNLSDKDQGKFINDIEDIFNTLQMAVVEENTRWNVSVAEAEEKRREEIMRSIQQKEKILEDAKQSLEGAKLEKLNAGIELERRRDLISRKVKLLEKLIENQGIVKEETEKIKNLKKELRNAKKQQAKLEEQRGDKREVVSQRVLELSGVRNLQEEHGLEFEDHGYRHADLIIEKEKVKGEISAIQREKEKLQRDLDEIQRKQDDFKKVMLMSMKKEKEHIEKEKVLGNVSDASYTYEAVIYIIECYDKLLGLYTDILSYNDKDIGEKKDLITRFFNYPKHLVMECEYKMLRLDFCPIVDIMDTFPSNIQKYTNFIITASNRNLVIAEIDQFTQSLISIISEELAGLKSEPHENLKEENFLDAIRAIKNALIGCIDHAVHLHDQMLLQEEFEKKLKEEKEEKARLLLEAEQKELEKLRILKEQKEKEQREAEEEEKKKKDALIEKEKEEIAATYGTRSTGVFRYDTNPDTLTLKARNLIIDKMASAYNAYMTKYTSLISKPTKEGYNALRNWGMPVLSKRETKGTKTFVIGDVLLRDCREPFMSSTTEALKKPRLNIEALKQSFDIFRNAVSDLNTCLKKHARQLSKSDNNNLSKAIDNRDIIEEINSIETLAVDQSTKELERLYQTNTRIQGIQLIQIDSNKNLTDFTEKLKNALNSLASKGSRTNTDVGSQEELVKNEFGKFMKNFCTMFMDTNNNNLSTFAMSVPRLSSNMVVYMNLFREYIINEFTHVTNIIHNNRVYTNKLYDIQFNNINTAIDALANTLVNHVKITFTGSGITVPGQHTFLTATVDSTKKFIRDYKIHTITSFN